MNNKVVEDFIFGAPAENHAPHLKIKGELPWYVRGTLYLNGPAKFHAKPSPQRHWLDGDGMARTLVIGQNGASYTSRYVATTKYKNEHEAGQALYRTFGTTFEGDALRKRLTIETPANVSLYAHGGRLLAFGEQSLPWELDQSTLETVGEWNFGGSYSSIAPFSAHPKFDPHKEEMHTFGITYFGRRGKLFYYGFDAEYKAIVKGETILKEGNYIHDFALSEQYACFHLAPYQLDVHAFIKKEVPLSQAMQWQQKGNLELRIFSRETGTVVARIPLNRETFCLHSINSWEEGGVLAIDLVDTPEPFFDQYIAKPHMFAGVKPCAAVRYLIDTNDWTIREKHVATSPLHYDFPTVAASSHMKPYQYFWAAGMPAAPEPAPKFYNTLFRFDWQTYDYQDQWQCGKGTCLGGEPQMIENPSDSNEGMVLSQVLNLESGESGYVFLDAFNLEKGPIASIDLDFYDPLGFHTS